jgi:hypothetical protein
MRQRQTDEAGIGEIRRPLVDDPVRTRIPRHPDLLIAIKLDLNMRRFGRNCDDVLTKRGDQAGGEPTPSERESMSKHVKDTFLLRKNVEDWGIDIERRIGRQEPASTRKSRNAQLFGDLVALHRRDLEEVGRVIGRSKMASLIFLDASLP